MIFQRRFHSHTPTSIDSPPTPPPKDNPSPPKTLEEILAIAVRPRAPKPPPHAVGTVASNPRVVQHAPLRSASSPLKGSVPKRAPSSRKTGHATIHTDPVGGHDAFESDAFAVHMPTTRIPIIDAPVSRPKAGSPTRAQAEAVQTYKEKAEQARKRNNSVGVRVPNNIASYDYAYRSTPKAEVAVPSILKPSRSPPAPAGAFPVSPPAAQQAWTRSDAKSESPPKPKISSNTSVYRKPSNPGISTSAAILSESISYVRADARGGAARPTRPPKSTTVKISLKSRTPSPSKPVVPTIKLEPCKPDAAPHAREAEHRRGMFYRSPHVEFEGSSRSPSPTKTMPNFARQYSIEGDSIFGYKVKNSDPLGTIAGADKSASNSDEEKAKPKPSFTGKGNGGVQAAATKRTLTDRWPWIRKDGGAAKGIGSPPKIAAPDPPVRPPGKSLGKRLANTYISPFDVIASPSDTPPITRVQPAKPAAARSTAAKPAAGQANAAKKGTTNLKSELLGAESSLDTSIQRVQSFIMLGVKIGLALYIVVALWFVLDALREALCMVIVPLRVLVVLVWMVISSIGRTLCVVVGSMTGKFRVLGRS